MNLHTTPHHPMQRCWNLATAAIQAEALDTALELGLFDGLAQPQSASDLAATKRLHADNTAHLLELLWSLGLLHRSSRAAGEDVYGLSPVARDFLNRSSATFCGDAWRYRMASLRTLAKRLRDHVEQGPQLPASPFQSATGAGWAAAARAQIGQEQRAITVAAALDAIRHLPRGQQPLRLLDLGGGPGWVAIEFARRYPELTGVVYDWPETAAVAQENINSAGLASRLCAQGGDMVKDAIGEDFDLVWCSSVLHFVPDISAVLARLLTAMAPGGRLVCVHAELPIDADEAAQVMPYYLPMRMLGRHVLSKGDTANALKAAGFVVEDGFLSRRFPMAPVQVVVAHKPVSPVPSATHHE